jgi:trans-aconitate methyltransferase
MNATAPDNPAGVFESVQAYDAEKKTLLTEKIRLTPTKLREAVSGLSDNQLDTLYKNWTIRQITHHIADSHLHSIIRFKWALTEDHPTIKAYEEADWVQLADAMHGDVEPALLLLDGIHAKWVQVLESMTEAQFARTYHHPQSGASVFGLHLITTPGMASIIPPRLSGYGSNMAGETSPTVHFDWRNKMSSSLARPGDDQWSPDLYDNKHSFVWKLGASVIELLSPQPGERILDVGCGTGQLTAQIAESRASVVGLDNSPAMIEEARRLFPEIEFQLADAHEFRVDDPFDGVFSNAALHWIKKPEKVAACISKALKPQGRMAVEFGGHGNVRHLSSAVESVAQSFLGEPLPHPWYFPGIAEFSSLLEQHGMEVIQAAMIDRPTALEGKDGLRNWVRMFGQHWLTQIPLDQHELFLEQVEETARPQLLHDSGWYADYRRIRVLAVKV